MYRLSNNVTAFIQGNSGTFPYAQHLITGNYFDNTTLDGSNENLIINFEVFIEL